MALSKSAALDTTAVSTSFSAEEPLEEIQMGINPAAVQAMVDRLTNLYPNPILSSVREITSNALDATVKMPKHQQLPVEITTPTVLNPALVVQDHGVGMSLDDVRKSYQYGGTTKADDFDQLGAYGLGAKAPLSYCSEFFVETTQAGVTTSFKIMRKAMGNSVVILSSEDTGAPSGTKVTLPARLSDVDEFRSALEKFTLSPVMVPLLVDGEPVKPRDPYIFLGTMILDEDTATEGRIWVAQEHLDAILAANGHRHHVWRATLSGWPYEVSKSSWRSALSTPLFILELKPGVVDFDSSRDSITSNERLEKLDAALRARCEVLKSDPEVLTRLVENFTPLEYMRLAAALRFQGRLSGQDLGVFASLDTPMAFSPLKEHPQSSGTPLVGVLSLNNDGTYFTAPKANGLPLSVDSELIQSATSMKGFKELYDLSWKTPNARLLDLPGLSIHGAVAFLGRQDFARRPDVQKATVVTGCTETLGRKLLTSRKFLSAEELTSLILLKGDPTPEELSTLRSLQYLELDVITQENLEKRLAKARKKARELPLGTQEVASYSVIKLNAGELTDRDNQFVVMTLEELQKAKESLVLVSSKSYSDRSQGYVRALLNEGHASKGETMIFMSAPLTATMARALRGREKIFRTYLPQEASSQTARNFLTQLPYLQYHETLNADMASISPEEFARTLWGTHASRVFTEENTASLLAALEESEVEGDLKILKAILSAPKHERLVRLSENELKRHASPGILAVVEGSVAILSEAFLAMERASRRWRATPCSHENILLFSLFGEHNPSPLGRAMRTEALRMLSDHLKTSREARKTSVDKASPEAS